MAGPERPFHPPTGGIDPPGPGMAPANREGRPVKTVFAWIRSAWEAVLRVERRTSLAEAPRRTTK